MAGVLGNTNLFSYCNQNEQNKDISVFPKRCSGSCSLPSAKLKSESLRLSASLDSDFCGRRVVFQENKGLPKRGISSKSSIKAQALQTGLIGKVQKWWEKGLQSNMKEVASAQDLVDSLLNAGDKLVIVDFFSPGCGGCKALHPKICQLAEMHPDVQFLHVNYEEQKSMCYSLNVHVLPFFRFYRGAHGRLCSFSCTNATIKKFKDALAKHTTDRCSLGPAKGLEEKELLALAANKELNFNYTPKPQPLPVPAQEEVAVAEAAPSHSNPNHPLPLHSSSPLKSANKELNFNFTPKPQPVPASAQEEVAVAEAATSHSNSNLPLPRRSTALKSAQDTKEKKTLVTAGTPQVRFGCLGRFFCLEERRPGSVQVKVDFQRR